MWSGLGVEGVLVHSAERSQASEFHADMADLFGCEIPCCMPCERPTCERSIANSGAQAMTPSASFETQTEVRETPFTSRTGENPTAYLVAVMRDVSCEARELGPG